MYHHKDILNDDVVAKASNCVVTPDYKDFHFYCTSCYYSSPVSTSSSIEITKDWLASVKIRLAHISSYQRSIYTPVNYFSEIDHNTNSSHSASCSDHSYTFLKRPKSMINRFPKSFIPTRLSKSAPFL